MARTGKNEVGVLEELNATAKQRLCSLFWMVSRSYDYAIVLLPLAVIVPILAERRPAFRAGCV